MFERLLLHTRLCGVCEFGGLIKQTALELKALQDMVEVLEQRLELELEEKKSSRDD